jgi:two-component system sensor histidine kinase AlgZ
MGKTQQAEHIPLLPDFRQATVVFIAVLVGELIAVMLSLVAAPDIESFWTALSVISLLVQWIVLAVLIVLMVLRPILALLDEGLALSIIYLIIVGISLVVGWIALSLGEYFGLMPDIPDFWFLLRLTGISGIIAAIFLRYLYVQQQWRRQDRAQALSRIEALRARIRPHFLFNSLNTITSLVRGRPREAEQAIADLAGLFRASLHAEEESTLEQELAVVRQYLDLEHLRLGDRLRIAWSIDDSVDESLVIPALILQPLIENAVYHGIEPSIEGGEIKIDISTFSGRLKIRIENPLTQSDTQREGNRIAQKNISQRLSLVYGQQASFEAHAGKDQYHVELILPIEEQA